MATLHWTARPLEREGWYVILDSEGRGVQKTNDLDEYASVAACWGIELTVEGEECHD